jgi:hypothetical protein
VGFTRGLGREAPILQPIGAKRPGRAHDTTFMWYISAPLFHKGKGV